MDEEEKYMLMDYLLPIATDPSVADETVNSMFVRGLAMVQSINSVANMKTQTENNKVVAEEIKKQLLVE